MTGTPTVRSDTRPSATDGSHLDPNRVISELQARDALKTQFLANISHDLRTPLTAIITNAEIMRDGILGELSSRHQDSVGSIIAGGRQLLHMVDEILAYARGAANQFTLARSTVAIGDEFSAGFSPMDLPPRVPGAAASLESPALRPQANFLDALSRNDAVANG